MKAVELVNVGIESSTGAPLVLLREHDEPHRLLPVFVGSFEASSITLALGGAEPSRPLTHDLMVSLVEHLDARVERVELTGFDGETFLAEVVIRGPRGDERLDSRPSDAIALAVRTGAPVFVSEEVLQRAGAAPATELLDDAAIDQEVDEFREFLSGVDPTDFAPTALSAPESDARQPADDGRPAPPEEAAPTDDRTIGGPAPDEPDTDVTAREAAEEPDANQDPSGK